MNILITGGSGTIGGYVIRELFQAGHAASSFSRTAPAVAGARFIQGDIQDLDLLKAACREHDAVVHLAAVPGPGRATPEHLLYINVIGTVNVLEAALHGGLRKVILASSGAATGFTFQKREIIPRYLPLNEDHPCEPQDEYGLSKLLAEVACKRYSDAYGMQTICLRINHNWYVDWDGARVAVGAGWARGLTVEELWAQRYRKILEDPEGDWPVPGPPSPKNILWAFTDARDAAQAFKLAVENDDIVHEVFFVNGADTCSKEETRSLIARYYPDVPLRAPLEGHATLWSYRKANRMLGYQPRYSWRKSDFRAWLDSQPS
jgi:nucleoside-diphosphate-sugar epimerase